MPPYVAATTGPSPARQASITRSIAAGAVRARRRARPPPPRLRAEVRVRPQRREAPGPRSQSGQPRRGHSLELVSAEDDDHVVDGAAADASSTGSSRSRCFGEPKRVEAPAASTTQATDLLRTESFERAADQRAGELDLVRGSAAAASPRRGRPALSSARDRRDAGERDPRRRRRGARRATPTSGNDQRSPVHRLQVGARLRRGDVELEEQLAGSSAATSRSSSVGSR